MAIIYGRGRLFGYRQCQGLAYASQGEADDDRAARRAERLRRQLEWEPGILNGPGHKPQRMHWRTYWRLAGEHDVLMAVSSEGMARRLGFLDRLFAEAKADRGW